MFQQIIDSTHQSKIVLIVNIEMVGPDSFTFNVLSQQNLFKEFNFKFDPKNLLQINGDYDSRSDWFDVVRGEMNLLIGRYKETPDIFNK